MEKNEKNVEFHENCIYTVFSAAEILHRSVQTVRQLCSSGRIQSRRDRGGYLITGWAIRKYAEGTLDAVENE